MHLSYFGQNMINAMDVFLKLVDLYFKYIKKWLNFQTQTDFLSPLCVPSPVFASLNFSILSVLSLSEGPHITAGKREEDLRLNAKHWIKHDYHVQAGPASEVSDYH